MGARTVRAGLLVAALLLLVGGSADAQQQPGIQVRARLTHSQAAVGDRIGFEISVMAPAGAAITVPDLPLRVGDLDLIERQPIESTPDGSEQRHRWVLAPFVTGELMVPPVQVSWRTADGRRGTALTEPLLLRVDSIIPAGDPGERVRDLRPQSAFADQPFRMPWALVSSATGLVALLLLFAILIRRLIRDAGRRRAQAPLVPLTAEDIARAALDELAAGGIPSLRTLKDYYAALSVVVRRYLTARFEFPAFALTTAEMEGRMTGEGIDRWQARLVTGLLVECDAVRYAQYIPAQQRARDDLGLAYEIVEVGRPQPVVAEVEPPPGDDAPPGSDPRPMAEPRGRSDG